MKRESLPDFLMQLHDSSSFQSYLNQTHLNEAVVSFLALQSFLRGLKCKETSSLEKLEEAFVSKFMRLQLACSIFSFMFWMTSRSAATNESSVISG